MLSERFTLFLTYKIELENPAIFAVFFFSISKMDKYVVIILKSGHIWDTNRYCMCVMFKNNYSHFIPFSQAAGIVSQDDTSNIVEARIPQVTVYTG